MRTSGRSRAEWPTLLCALPVSSQTSLSDPSCLTSETASHEGRPVEELLDYLIRRWKTSLCLYISFKQNENE